MGKLEGKVAFITGAARGQGRSHAIRLAEEGADIIAVDLCQQIDTVQYPMAKPEDLNETSTLVEGLGRRIVSRQADVRDRAALQAAFDDGLAALGGVDIVLANAGIAPTGGGYTDEAFLNIVDVNLTGTWNTLQVAVPTMIEQGRGGAIVITSSTAGLKGYPTRSSGMDGYVASKHGVVGLMRNYAIQLAKHSIRVNTVHPTAVNTPMVDNEAMRAFLIDNPDLANGALTNLLPVETVEAIDISNAIAWLVSDDGRYVTGVTLPVDAGFVVK